jgi:hypothetical protein
MNDFNSGQGRTLFLRTRDGRLITISTTRPVPRRVADVRALVDTYFKTPGNGGSNSVEKGNDAGGTHPTNEK